MWAGSLGVIPPARAEGGGQRTGLERGTSQWWSLWCLMGTQVTALPSSVSFNVSTRGITEEIGCCY